MNERETPEALARLPLAALRERAQGPMRGSNDLGGVLFGDWVSPILTREFLRFGISPTVGTLGMLGAGLAGAVLLPFGGVWSVLAALLFVLFYVLDCVDGEVARLRGIDSYFWSFPDFFIGAAVMAAFHLSLGIYVYLLSGIAWALLAGAALALALFLKKFMDVCHVFLAVGHVVNATPARRERYLAELGISEGGEQVAEGSEAEPASRRDVIAQYGRSPHALLRAVATNFHLAMLGFLGVALLDLVVGPWRLGGVTFDLKCLFLALYLPLYLAHVADHMIALSRGAFLRRSGAIIRGLRSSFRRMA